MNKLWIIKIGGNVIDHPEKLQEFLTAFAQITDPKILVHGGGKIATQLAEKLDIEQQFYQGRRITDSESLDIAVMVYAGLLNKNIVASLQAKGCNALGLSGADANTIPATKRPVEKVDFGWVGNVETTQINSLFINSCLQNHITPVFCAITHNNQGQLLNTNADTVAQSLAVALSKNYQTQLVFCFEKKGVLETLSDDNSVISTITPHLFKQLLSENKIHSGMLPKLENAFDALAKGVNIVNIIQDTDLASLCNHNHNYGTTIKL